MTTHAIERHYATVATRWGDRQIHYRRSGTGPAVLLLHQSPQSSAEYEDLILAWADRFTVFAPDYPGFGDSDPLGDDGELVVSLDDFAAVLIAWMDEIGLESAPAYGFHTGAGMAVAMADASPSNIPAVYANGYVILNQQEAESILSGYLPPFAPEWDGAHLLWLWTRNRDQLIFFPWFDRRAEARIHRDIPPPEELHKWAIELLRAGDHYRVGYRAAFLYPGDEPLRRLQVPAIITATATDVLAAFLERVTEPADGVVARVGGSMQDNLDEAAAYFVEHPGSDAPAVAATRPIAGRPWHRMVAYAGGAVRVRVSGDVSRRPVLLVHGAGGSSATVAALFDELAAQRAVIAVDLPGHGESTPPPAGMDYLAACAASLSAVIDAFGLDVIDAWGEREGAAVLAEFATRSASRLRALALSEVPDWSADDAADLAEHFAPRIEPVWYGGHLLEYWHVARNRYLFSPWYRQTEAAAVAGEPHVGADELHVRALALMQSAAVLPAAAAALYSYPLDGALKKLTLPLHTAAAPLAQDILEFFAGVNDD